ncbi:universal stress protein [Pollutimonas harenae]|uniref:Universal stress protein n=1 Tax=Pollutimonas harenae TaxID=657015 RepID=A0A853H1Q7_9BURK|nr:universal stress protein [Pollutimonas harenae]NYT85719.1 universal stress protein [Pollutimonas harenae]TEA70790.1 universal stress protein [Pollutimonas harenae]
MYKRILVATDGSELSAKAVSTALDFAQLANAELVALNVIPPSPVSYWDGTSRSQMNAVTVTESAHIEAGQNIVHAVKEAGELKGVSTQAITIKSDLVAESIISAAHQYECELIVMASHGRRGINRVLMGNETMNVLTHSKIPVLVLR